MNGKLKLLALGCLLSTVPTIVMAGQATGQTIAESKRSAALELARLLNDSRFTATVARSFEEAPQSTRGSSISTPLRSLLAAYVPEGAARASVQSLQAAEMKALRAKGTQALSNGLFELRIYLPAGHAMPTRLDKLWVAFEPAGDESTWTRIEAFDANGNVHLLDPKAKPSSPVLIVDIDGREDMRAGIELMNGVLREHGLQAGAAPHANLKQAGGNEFTVLQKISVKDDEEPFISGDADMYVIESGVNTNGDKPLVVIHDMPWLDDSGVTYYPGQHVVFWANHSLNLANLLIMEQDDNVDWGSKAQEILKAVTAIVGPIKPEAAIVAAIGQAILSAVPDGVLTNDDDYVDSYYLLEKGRAYTDRAGARDNATATFVPLSVPSNDI